MKARQFVIMFALAALAVSTGCQGWCQQHYPCPQPVVASAPPCVPCTPCCPSGYAPAPAVPASTPAWNAPARSGACCP
jgi:hypothetical protein